MRKELQELSHSSSLLLPHFFLNSSLLSSPLSAAIVPPSPLLSQAPKFMIGHFDLQAADCHFWSKHKKMYQMPLRFQCWLSVKTWWSLKRKGMFLDSQMTLWNCTDPKEFSHFFRFSEEYFLLDVRPLHLLDPCHILKHLLKKNNEIKLSSKTEPQI